VLVLLPCERHSEIEQFCLRFQSCRCKCPFFFYFSFIFPFFFPSVLISFFPFFLFIYLFIYLFCWPGQLNRYSHSLWDGRCGDRCPVGARFSAHIQTRPGSHRAFYTIRNKAAWGVALFTHPHITKVKVKFSRYRPEQASRDPEG
jgi:hypothetical protein